MLLLPEVQEKRGVPKVFFVVGFQKKEESKQQFIASLDKRKAQKCYDKMINKKFYRICLIKYYSKTEYEVLKQAEWGEDKTFELLI